MKVHSFVCSTVLVNSYVMPIFCLSQVQEKPWHRGDAAKKSRMNVADVEVERKHHFAGTQIGSENVRI